MVETYVYFDALRVLAVVPIFAYASYLDIQERRVPHKTWYPLGVVGTIALVADLLLRPEDPGTVLMFLAISFTLGVVFGYGFYYLGTFGGADRYALVVIGFAFPIYPFLGTQFEAFVVPELPVFVLSVLGNTVLAGIAYPLKLFGENLVKRNTANPLLMLLAKRVSTDTLHDEFGRVLGTDDDVSIRRSGVFGATEGVTDIDFVRDYVEWRGVESIRDARDMDLRLQDFVNSTPWMSDNIERDAEELREIAEQDAVWISPGIPFIVPMFVGIVVALTAGDVLFALMRAVFGL
ncbi:MAG: A24 family peptidase C-terminal domain-containing protein [Halobacteriales archaeon]|nr:A24 family peptidase C-terminal domain-containing protein [Halobacteriales archaeon]